MDPAAIDHLNDNPMYAVVGIRVHEAAEGRARATLVPPETLCWPFPGQPHGGVLATFLDTTMAWAVFSDLSVDQNCATIHLDVDFLRPAKGERFTCFAWTVHRSGRLCFTRAEIRDAAGHAVAIAQAAFRIIKTPVPAAAPGSQHHSGFP